MESPKHFCPVCQTQNTGAFCVNCGQKVKKEKVSFLGLLADLINGLFSLEHSIFGSIWMVLSKPKSIIEAYLNGFRRYYKSPGQIAFYAAFAIGLQFTFGGMTLLGLQVSFNNDAIPPQIIVLAVLIPFYALISKVAFWKNRKSYLGHLISMIYLFSAWLIIFIILENIIKLTLPIKLSFTILGIFLGLLFLWNSLVQLNKPNWKNVTLFTLIQMAITVAIFLGIAFVVYTYFPERITRTEM